MLIHSIRGSRSRSQTRSQTRSRTNSPTRRGRRALVTGLTVVTALVLAACGGDDGGGAPETTPSAASSRGTTASGETWNEADVAFAQMMIPDHQMVAQMATLAQKKATTKELKALSQRMKTGQTRAAEKLTGWLSAWGQPTTATGKMDMPGAMSEQDMAMLTSMKKGMHFDMMFAQMMAEHHKGVLTMAEDELANGKNPEAKAMATSMVKTLKTQVGGLEAIADMS